MVHPVDPSKVDHDDAHMDVNLTHGVLFAGLGICLKSLLPPEGTEGAYLEVAQKLNVAELRLRWIDRFTQAYLVQELVRFSWQTGTMYGKHQSRHL